MSQFPKWGVTKITPFFSVSASIDVLPAFGGGPPARSRSSSVQRGRWVNSDSTWRSCENCALRSAGRVKRVRRDRVPGACWPAWRLAYGVGARRAAHPVPSRSRTEPLRDRTASMRCHPCQARRVASRRDASVRDLAVQRVGRLRHSRGEARPSIGDNPSSPNASPKEQPPDGHARRDRFRRHRAAAWPHHRYQCLVAGAAALAAWHRQLLHLPARGQPRSPDRAPAARLGALAI